MKGGVLAAGAVLLIIGFLIFWTGYSVVQQYSTSLGQLGLALSSEAQNQYQQAQLQVMIGGILAFIGFVVCIYGAAASPAGKQIRPVVVSKPVPTATPQEPPKAVQTILAICPQCKNRIPADAKFCSQCGADLRPKAT